MTFEYLFVLTIILSFFILLIQRTESGKRKLVSFLLILPLLLTRYFAISRDAELEGWVAILLALLLNFLFWLLIGRYNPVPSSDEIKVLGLDD